MNITVAGQHITLGESLQKYVKEKTTTTVKRYCERATRVDIHFSKQNHQLFFCDIIIYDGAGERLVIKSDTTSENIYSSFDGALAVAAKRLKKYHSKLRDKNHGVKLSMNVMESL